MKKIIIIIAVFVISSSSMVFGQSNRNVIAEARVLDGDTIPYIRLREVVIFNKILFKNKRDARNYEKLVRHVKKVYPYAKIAGDKLREYNDTLSKVTSEKQRKQLMQQAENEIRAQFEGDLKKLTFTQGTILIKLIDRETKYCSYELVQDLRGTMMAVVWQGFARVFGYNLKSEYDPKNEDKYIERIVLMIEAGQI